MVYWFGVAYSKFHIIIPKSKLMCRSAFGVLIGMRQNYRTTLVQNHEYVANETKNQDVLMIPAGGNILSLEFFCVHVVKTKMSQLAFSYSL